MQNAKTALWIRSKNLYGKPIKTEVEVIEKLSGMRTRVAYFDKEGASQIRIIKNENLIFQSPISKI